MEKALKHIKNEIRLRTSDMENEDYISFMREVAAWCENEANILEYQPEMAMEDEKE